MKLYYVPGACSIAPQIVLRELGEPFTLDRIDLKAGKKTQGGESYVGKNPKGYVPALELESGELITECSVILQFLADSRPAANLAPPNGTMGRVRLQETLNFIATELHKGFSPLFQPTANDEFKSAWRQNRLAVRLEVFSKMLADKPYLMGDAFSVADAYGFYVLNTWLVSPVLKGDLTAWPKLAEYHARLKERPSVRKSLEVESAPVAA